MPQIIVVADSRADCQDRAVMFTERVSVHDFESRHFQSQLVQRLGWAVGDAHHVEQSLEPTEPTEPTEHTEHSDAPAWEADEPTQDRTPERESVSNAGPVS